MVKKALNAAMILVFTLIGLAPFPVLAAKAKISILNLKMEKGHYSPPSLNGGTSHSTSGGSGNRR